MNEMELGERAKTNCGFKERHWLRSGIRNLRTGEQGPNSQHASPASTLAKRNIDLKNLIRNREATATNLVQVLGRKVREKSKCAAHKEEHNG
jgi:hypothetical protein